jgi:hypothetical protein
VGTQPLDLIGAQLGRHAGCRYVQAAARIEKLVVRDAALASGLIDRREVHDFQYATRC